MRKFTLNKCFITTIVALLLCSVLQAQSFEVDGVMYEVISSNPHSVRVIGSNGYYSGDVIIPPTVKIGNAVFNVTTIDYRAFQFCTNLISVEIPNSVTSIENGAFYGCSGLTSIMVDNNNVVYDSRDDCNAIIETATDKLIVGSSTTIIPNSILSIGDAAFYRCTGLTSINIPNSVISIGFSAFSQCGCLTSIVVSPNNKVYDSRDNCNAIIETATNTLMFGCNTTIIPSTITSIGSFAFSGCSGIISMEIPSSVRSIGGYAFDGMSKLETLYILNPDANVAADSRALHNKNLKHIKAPASLFSVAATELKNTTNSIETLVITSGSITDDGYAFINRQCKSIVSIDLKGTDGTVIADESLFDCYKLEYIVFPKNIRSIGNKALSGCISLKSINLPASLEEIGYNAFADCVGAQSINCAALVPPTTTRSFVGLDENIQVNVNCDALESYKKAEEWSKFTNFKCNDDPVPEPKSYTIRFLNYDGIELYSRDFEEGSTPFYGGEMPQKEATAEYSYSFIGWEPKISVVTEPQTYTAQYSSVKNKYVVKFINDDEILQSTPVEYGSMPEYTGETPVKSPTAEFNYVFSGWIPKIEPVTQPQAYSAQFNIIGEKEMCIDGIWYRKLDENNVEVFKHSSQELYCGDIVIPESVECLDKEWVVSGIAASAFSNCTDLNSIVIPKKLISIGANAFSGCKGLKSVFWNAENAVNNDFYSRSAFYDSPVETFVFGPDVKQIPRECCSRLTKVSVIEIPEGVEKIGSYAFYECTGLSSVTIPENVKIIETGAFDFCSNISSVRFNAIECSVDVKYGLFYNSPVDYFVFGPNVMSIPTRICFGLTNLTNIVLPQSVKSIGGFSFYGCVGLTQMDIPQNVKTINESAFYNCSNISKLEIPDSVESIGVDAFNGMSSLDTLIIYNPSVNVSSTSKAVHNKSLKYLKAPASILSVSESDLVNTTNSIVKMVVTGGTVTDDGFAFINRQRKSLLSLDLGGMASEELADEALSECYKMETLVLPESLKSIGYKSLSGCVALKGINLPASLDEIGYNALANCIGLTYISCNALVSPSTLQSFTGVDKSIPVYVPCGSVEAYKAASEWKEFANIKCIDSAEPVEEPVEEPVVEPQTTSVEITWPASTEADTYVITITLNSEPFCTLTFDASGLLVNIEYANEGGFGKSAGLRSATANIGGFRYNVTGLSENTTYDYSVQTFNVLGSVIDEYDGDFTTPGDVPTLVSESKASSAKKTLKYYENGSVVIERDGNKFDLRGVGVR